MPRPDIARARCSDSGCELELTTWAAVEDYWDRRGWPRRPLPVRPGSRIDVPAHRAHLPAGTTTIAGFA